jgi:hypothetical protein
VVVKTPTAKPKPTKAAVQKVVKKPPARPKVRRKPAKAACSGLDCL